MDPFRVILISGASGAGKTASLKILEDMGYETVDGVPLSLLGSLVKPREPEFPVDGIRQPLAVGVDVRTRGFGAENLMQELESLWNREDIDLTFLFLDCDDDVLSRRYKETRHTHPFAQDRPVPDGIRLERALLKPLRERADVLVDTTDLALKDFRQVLDGHFGLSRHTGISIFVTSFSFRHGIPRDADLVFDVRFLRNPHYVPELKAQTGLDPAVGEYVRQDEDYAGFFSHLTTLLKPLLPRYSAEGKSYLTIAIGCTGGQHRSVFLTEELGRWLDDTGQNVQVGHRELDRRKT